MATSYSIVILTAQHSISGELQFSDVRLSDFLNDRRDTAVALINTKVARLAEPSKILQQHPTSVIPKAWIVLAFEPPQKAIPHDKRLFGYVRKERYAVFMILEGMEVRGSLHSHGDLELRRMLATTSDSFVPLTQAAVTMYENDRYVIEQDAIMVNTRLIRYVGAIEAPKQPL